MNDQQRAAMQMALDLLIGGAEPAATQKKADDGMCAQWDVDAWEAITALREALAQPQGEWVDLTRDEITAAYWSESPDTTTHHAPLKGMYAIIAKFKEKNTPPVVPQGEPVAWIHRYKTGAEQINTAPPETYVGWTHIPLYTTPPSVEAAVEETIERALACYSPDDTAQDWADKIKDLK